MKLRMIAVLNGLWLAKGNLKSVICEGRYVRTPYMYLIVRNKFFDIVKLTYSLCKPYQFSVNFAGVVRCYW